MINLPANVTETMKLLANSGFEVYAVGGSVRDALMGIPPKDWDLATNARLWNLEGLFPDAKIISEKYSVVRRDFPESHLDIATFRKEGDYSDSRRPDWVEFVDTLEEDAVRRDFTVNAIAYSLSGEVVDPYDGMQDLLDKRIRCIGDPKIRFRENPIRMLRAARMAADFGFWPDDSVRAAMLEMSADLVHTGSDRIRADLLKLIGGKYPSNGLKLLVETHLLEPVLGISKGDLPDASRKKIIELIQTIDAIQTSTKGAVMDAKGGGGTDLAERRLGSLYRCLGTEQGKQAIFALNFDKQTRRRLESYLHQETEETC